MTNELVINYRAAVPDMSYRPGGVPLGGGNVSWLPRGRDEEEEIDVVSVGSGGTRINWPDMDSLCHSTAGKVGAGCGCCVALTLLVMLLTSFKGLHATEFAILRNSATGVVSFGSTYHGGRNFIGFWNDYLVFPATIQCLAQVFGVRQFPCLGFCGAYGGVRICWFCRKETQNKGNVADLALALSTVVRDVSPWEATIANYKATELYTKRPQATHGRSIESRVCQQNLQGFLTCWGIQLLTVSFDERIEKANVRQQVTAGGHVEDPTDCCLGGHRAVPFARQVKIVNVEADAAAVNITKKAKADADYNMQQAAGEAALMRPEESSVSREDSDSLQLTAIIELSWRGAEAIRQLVNEVQLEYTETGRSGVKTVK
eukprot:Skav231924  [mRNA]  locus=scaffold2322:40671:51006:- [translate_table: standard]